MEQKELMEKLKAAESAEKIVEILKDQGQTITEEEAKHLYDAAHTAKELSDEDLDAVAGGSARTSDGYLIVSQFNGCKRCSSGAYFCACCRYLRIQRDGLMFCQMDKI